MSEIEIYGTLGAIFFGICALPQAFKVWQTQSTKSLSLMFLILWALGEIFMWTYVIKDNSASGNIQWPLHANYIFNALILIYLLYKKIKNKKKWNKYNG